MPVLKDIALGKYVSVDSAVHRLDPRTKFLGLMLLMTAIVSTPGFGAMALFTLFLTAAVALSNIPFVFVLKNLRPFVWLFSFTLLFHAFMTAGTVIWQLPALGLVLTFEGLYAGAFFCARLSILVTLASLLTLTTTPMELTDGLERILGPLKRFRFPAHELAMMVTIALRFIPVLVEEAERLQKAQTARGADFGGGPIQRVRKLVPLLVPLFISAFSRADRLALAMESRCYRGGEGRTSYSELAFHGRDLRAGIAVVIAVACAALIPNFPDWLNGWLNG
jgi:energy-coupling factor transport system permease protein